MGRMEKKDRIKKLPESELEIMLSIWRAAEEEKEGAEMTAVTSAYVGREMKEKGWADTTVLNFLARLVEKGFLHREKQGKLNLYSPVVTEEEYLSRESRSFLEKLYGNSARNMVAAMYQDRAISDGDLAEIKAFIEAQMELGSNAQAQRDAAEGTQSTAVEGTQSAAKNR